MPYFGVPDIKTCKERISSNGLVTFLEVTENFWRLWRTAKRFEILSQNFEVISAESRNHA